jgi:hypothetical protein
MGISREYMLTFDIYVYDKNCFWRHNLGQRLILLFSRDVLDILQGNIWMISYFMFLETITFFA